MSANRIGFWSSAILVGIGIAYLLALAAGFARHGLNEPIADPILAVMELLTLLSAPAVVLALLFAGAAFSGGEVEHTAQCFSMI